MNKKENKTKKNKIKKSKVKKVLIIIAISILVLITILYIIYNILLSPVSKQSEVVDFNIISGTSRVDIIKDLHSAGIIKNELAAIVYTGIHNLKLQAGEYRLNRDDSTRNILKKIAKGEIKEPDTINVTFVEGKRITEYAKVISEAFGYDYNEVLAVFKDKDYASELINKYSFLTSDILDKEIYYPLEGYLFPSKYNFYQTASIKEIIEKMLKEMGNRLNDIKVNIDDANLTVHELLTMASIVEAEGTNATNRASIAQVINKRISIGMNLGMDVTTYYAVQKNLTEALTKKDLASKSKYNTRLESYLGLPIGPICSPSLESINASLNPSNTNYLYFYASSDGTIKFTDSYDEFLVFKRNG